MNSSTTNTAKPESERKIQFAETAKKEDGKTALRTPIRRFHHPTLKTDPVERSKQIVENALKNERLPVVVCDSSCEDGEDHEGSEEEGSGDGGECEGGKDVDSGDEDSVEDRRQAWQRRDDSDSMWELGELVQRSEDFLARRLVHVVKEGIYSPLYKYM